MTEGNYVKIFVSSGGKGSTHLHREKFIEKAVQRWIGAVLVGQGFGLYFTKICTSYKKGNGGDGSGDSTGADGDDKFIEVPLGTVVKDKMKSCSKSLRMKTSAF
jgi:GTP-binding protein